MKIIKFVMEGSLSMVMDRLRNKYSVKNIKFIICLVVIFILQIMLFIY